MPGHIFLLVKLALSIAFDLHHPVSYLAKPFHRMPRMFSWLCFLCLNSICALAHFNDFVFNGFRNSNLSLAGMANINSAGVLELTNVTQLMLGHALYPFPLHFKNSSTNSTLSFSTTFVMSIVPRYPTLGGHGIAFLLSPFKGLQKALPSQYLGLFNASSNGKAFNHIFAVEFDTAKDFELLDIDDNHVGIDINSLISNMSTTAGYRTSNGTVQEFNLKAQKSIQCWIDFDGAENRLNVSVVPGGMPKPNRPLISIHVKLSDVLLDYMYVGFSASTGLLSSAHRILGWSFRMNGPAQDLQLSKLPEITYANSMVKTRRFRIGVSLAAVALMAVATLAAIHVIRRIRQSKVTEEWELEYGPHRFPYNELKVATKGFRDKELLGIGGFGRVYKGVIPSTGREVAVKRVSHESKQGVREFVAEIASIGLLRHRNLVQLQGWCRHKEDLLLVYDYMPNGSLDKLLFGSTQNMLTWSQRYTILKGVSLALLYLHEEWEQIVVHRDVKASNVLLDEDLNGRLGDFGLARLYEHGSNPHTSHVVGTIGYLAPELPRTGKATTSTDVFAFGALLLEVTCGRKPIEPNTSPEELVLVDWVRELHSKGKLLQAADPRLLNEYPVEEVGLVLELGLLCSHPHPEARPSMREVVQMLGVDKPRPVLPSDPPLADTPTRSEHFDEFNVAFSSYKHDSSIAISHASRSSDRRPVLTPDGTSPLSLLAGTD